MLLPSRNISLPAVTFLYFRIPFNLQASPLIFGLKDPESLTEANEANEVGRRKRIKNERIFGNEGDEAKEEVTGGG